MVFSYISTDNHQHIFEYRNPMFLEGLRKTDLRKERRSQKGISYKTNKKGTQLKVTDVYKPIIFRHEDGTKTVVRRNLTAKVALILEFHDYRWLKAVAPKFAIEKNKKLTIEEVEEIGKQSLQAASHNEDRIIGAYSQELALKFQNERLEKLPDLRIKTSNWLIFSG